MKPSKYEIRLEGILDAQWGEWFGDPAIANGIDGTTTLTVAVTDQAALHGLLRKIGSLGMTLISVNAIDREGPK